MSCIVVWKNQENEDNKIIITNKKVEETAWLKLL